MYFIHISVNKYLFLYQSENDYLSPGQSSISEINLNL